MKEDSEEESDAGEGLEEWCGRGGVGEGDRE